MFWMTDIYHMCLLQYFLSIDSLFSHSLDFFSTQNRSFILMKCHLSFLSFMSHAFVVTCKMSATICKVIYVFSYLTL